MRILVHILGQNQGGWNQWRPTQRLSIDDSPRFGTSLALGDGLIVVGDPSVGRAYLFQDMDPIRWARNRTLIHTFETPFECGNETNECAFGQSVVVTRAGEYVAIGAPNCTFVNETHAFRSGCVYVYARHRSGFGAYGHIQTLYAQTYNASTGVLAQDVGVEEGFGYTLTMNGGEGAPQVLVVGTRAFRDRANPQKYLPTIYAFGRAQDRSTVRDPERGAMWLCVGRLTGAESSRM
jgi:hypothetical protein